MGEQVVFMYGNTGPTENATSATTAPAAAGASAGAQGESVD